MDRNDQNAAVLPVPPAPPREAVKRAFIVPRLERHDKLPQVTGFSF